jgi:hypothetical protein
MVDAPRARPIRRQSGPPRPVQSSPRCHSPRVGIPARRRTHRAHKMAAKTHTRHCGKRRGCALVQTHGAPSLGRLTLNAQMESSGPERARVVSSRWAVCSTGWCAAGLRPRRGVGFVVRGVEARTRMARQRRQASVKPGRRPPVRGGLIKARPVSRPANNGDGEAPVGPSLMAPFLVGDAVAVFSGERAPRKHGARRRPRGARRARLIPEALEGPTWAP